MEILLNPERQKFIIENLIIEKDLEEVMFS